MVTKNLHDEVAEMPDVKEDNNFFSIETGPDDYSYKRSEEWEEDMYYQQRSLVLKM